MAISAGINDMRQNMEGSFNVNRNYKETLIKRQTVTAENFTSHNEERWYG